MMKKEVSKEMKLFKRKKLIREFSTEDNIKFYESSLNIIKSLRDELPDESENFDHIIERVEKIVEKYKKNHERD